VSCSKTLDQLGRARLAAPVLACRDGAWLSLSTAEYQHGGVSCASYTALGPRWVRVTTVEQRHGRSLTVAHGSEEPQVAGPSAHAAGITQPRDSDCGPEGQRSSGPAPRLRRGCVSHSTGHLSPSGGCFSPSGGPPDPRMASAVAFAADVTELVPK
jgi:hypothetical protein